MKILKRKNGNWIDIVLYIFIALMTGTIVLFGTMFINEIHDGLINTSFVQENTDAQNVLTKSNTNFPRFYDYILPMIYIGFLGFSAWSARNIKSSHMFLILGVLISMLIFFLSFVAEAAWDSVINGADIVSNIFLRGDLTFTNFFINELRWFVLVYGVIVAWALYSKDD